MNITSKHYQCQNPQKQTDVIRIFGLQAYISKIYTKAMKRSIGKRAGNKLLAVRVAEELLPYLDRGVKKENSDRARFIRNAIREKMARHRAIVKLESG